jgi:hypothetical protein
MAFGRRSINSTRRVQVIALGAEAGLFDGETNTSPELVNKIARKVRISPREVKVILSDELAQIPLPFPEVTPSANS